MAESGRRDKSDRLTAISLVDSRVVLTNTIFGAGEPAYPENSERATRIELASSVWKTEALPLSYARISAELLVASTTTNSAVPYPTPNHFQKPPLAQVTCRRHSVQGPPGRCENDGARSAPPSSSKNKLPKPT